MSIGKSDPRSLPEHFSLARYQRIAGLHEGKPELFARLNRHEPITCRHRYRKFGSGPRTACLIERGAPVLMVAHVDTVRLPSRSTGVVGGRLYHNAIDDRLGVYLGLEVLPAMGLPVDLLLTTGEEEGCSTAALMRTRKRYRWMFSFDRGGEDVVCYQYECAWLGDMLRASGFTIGIGSYSCIAELGHLGCRGINYGCGMFGYHSDSAYCDLAMLGRQLRRFEAFYRQFSQVRLPYRPTNRLRTCRAVISWAAGRSSRC